MKCVILSLAIAWFSAHGQASASSPLLVYPESPSTLTVMSQGKSYLDFSLVGWGPNWGWLGFSGTARADQHKAILQNSTRSGGADITAAITASRPSPRQLRIEVETSTSQDVSLTGLYLVVTAASPPFDQGGVRVTTAGATREIPMPLDKKGLGARVERFALADAAGRETTIALTPPADIPTDGNIRIQLAGAELKAAQPARLVLMVDFPGDIAWHADPARVPVAANLDDWFEFRPGDDLEKPSEIGMENWIEAPAGRHGRILRDADKLLYNGKPLKLWGLNLCYGACAPDKEMADKRARFYRRYGINAVRLHKYAEGGTLSRHSYVQFDPEGLDRMDYFIAQLKRQGIYVELSTQFGTPPLGREDLAIVPYLEEFGSFSRSDHITPPHSASHYSPELQDAHIRHMVNLLRHRNPHTGLTYAEDPALAFIEIINEQSILFFTSMAPLKASPTLRKKVGLRFGDWLRAKYGTHERLEAAWGRSALNSFEKEGMRDGPEQLDRNNILPLGNPWYWDPAQLGGSQSFRQRRLLDTLRFLYELQNAFYDRFVQAVRAAGYPGEIVASNWQAGRAYSHYYNLHSDALVGTVDRHNYFGGGDGGRIDDATMLAAPGSGLLGSGLQQVAGHPFMLSEWIHVTPNEWGVEGPAIIGAYGMGLQGWDASFMFQNTDDGGFSKRIGRDRWDVTAPHVLGVFPAVARQVLRGDISEAPLVAPLRVHPPSLDLPKLGFEDKVTQQYDLKTFETDAVPAATLAAARCVVEFTDSLQPTPRFSLADHEQSGWLNAVTGQLRWQRGGTRLDGCFTVNTPATKGVIGFASGQSLSLGGVTITPESRFAAIYVTAKNPGETIHSARQLLIVAIARARNSGMRVLEDQRILSPGKPPVVMEPVRARIQIDRPGPAALMVLDHDGGRTGRQFAVDAGGFEINGVRDRSGYYLVEY